jgi:hypothetical protein
MRWNARLHFALHAYSFKISRRVMTPNGSFPSMPELSRYTVQEVATCGRGELLDRVQYQSLLVVLFTIATGGGYGYAARNEGMMPASFLNLFSLTSV